MNQQIKKLFEAVRSEEDINQLKNFILDQAMRGRLVPQDPNDESAGVLLQKIEEGKELLVKKGKIKKQKTIPEIEESEVPYDLPNGWEWGILGNITEIRRGASPRPIKNFITDSDEGINWIKIGDSVVGNKYITSTKEKITVEGAKKSVYLNAGSLIMSNSMSFGKAYILGIDGCIHDGWLSFTIIDNHIFDELLLLFLNGSFKQFEEKAVGTGVRNLNIDRVKRTFLPIPPLNEQKRIVMKIEELFSLCDELKEKIRNHHLTSSKFNQSIFSRLQDPTNTLMKEDLQFFIEHMGDLMQSKEDVDLLRKSILSLGLRGKLVPQDPNDEPASVLLEKIALKREVLIKEKKIKKEKILSSITEAEQPYKLPKGWEWVRLSNIVSKLGSGSTPKGGREVYSEAGIKFIRSQNVWNNGLLLENVAYISEEIHSRMKGSTVEKSDILLNITGASIGRSCVVPESFDTGNVNQHVAIIRLIDKTIKEYIHLSLISPYVQEMIRDVEVGISREGLSMTKLKQFLIPIPPLNEQRRIMERLPHLMNLCDELERKIKSINEQQNHLLQSVLHQASQQQDQKLLEA
ncbi:restriction endonuclease subunit S [Priestia aryabhattai]|uniref:restriction endonuclease subunit S n=3 Tax=Priestia aryabhattai TaxID=412384 RepID=UPI003D2827FB